MMSDVDVDVASIDANVVESEPQKRAKEDEDEVRIPPSFSCFVLFLRNAYHHISTSVRIQSSSLLKATEHYLFVIFS